MPKDLLQAFPTLCRTTDRCQQGDRKTLAIRRSQLVFRVLLNNIRACKSHVISRGRDPDSRVNSFRGLERVFKYIPCNEI